MGLGLVDSAYAFRPCQWMGHNSGMYIVAIGWLYVTVLVAMNEPTLFSGLISFAFYGLLPCSLLLWFSGTRVRRERRRHKELLAHRQANQPDRSDPAADQ